MSGPCEGDRTLSAHQSRAAIQTESILDGVATRLGAVVRADAGDARVEASILIGHGVPVLTLNATIVGTDLQEDAVLWARTLIAVGAHGFHVKRADA